jgi:hypothetical protein
MPKIDWLPVEQLPQVVSCQWLDRTGAEDKLAHEITRCLPSDSPELRDEASRESE